MAKNKNTNEKISLTSRKTSHSKQERLIIWLLRAGTFLLFLPAMSNDFLFGWDDGEYITHPDVKNFGPGSGASIFRSFHLGMYQPLAVLSFAVNYAWAGENAGMFILVNILLHIANTGLVYKLTRTWSGRFEPAFITALLFTIHPMHVEGVVWISVRSSLLYSFFFLAGLLQYEKYLQSKKTGHYLLTLLWALLALFSKSMAATFPLILLAIDYFRQRKFSLPLLYEKLPFFAFSVIFGLVAIKASSTFGHITVLEADYNLLQRTGLLLYGISFYLLKLLVPVNLSVIYAFPATSQSLSGAALQGGGLQGALPGWAYLTMILVFAFGYLIYSQRNKGRWVIFGALFFLLSISMVLPLFWSRIFITADRYTYLPYIGLFLIIAQLLVRLWDNKESIMPSTRKLLVWTAGSLLLLLAVATFNRIKTWEDVPTLLADVIDNRRSDADMAHGYFYLGNYYDLNGKDEEAIKNYDLALSRNPGYLLALNNRGILKGKKADLYSAVSDFTKAIELKPDYAEAWYNRGVASYQMKQTDNACNDWNQAAKLGFKQANAVISQYCFKTTLPDFNKLK